MKISLFKKSFLLLTIAMSHQVIANPQNLSAWQFQLGGGLYNTDQGTKGSSIAISTVETDSLIQKNKNYFPLLATSLRKKIKTAKGSWYVGPSLYYHNQRFSGDVYQFTLPSLNNYSYTYKSTVIDAVMGSEYILPQKFKNLNFVISGGLGLTRAKSNYSETAKGNISSRSTRSTNSKIDVGFLYELGAGIVMPIKKDTALNVKYLFQNRNNKRTSKQSINQNLLSGVRSMLNTHSLLLSIDHKFNY